MWRRILLLCWLPAKLWAYEVAIEGNARTENVYIDRLLNRCFDDLKEAPKSEIETCLMDSKIFSEVVVDKRSDGMTVTIKDRWTLIPIPNLQVSKTDTRYGLFLVETNFLGMGHRIIAGGFSGNRAELGYGSFQFKNVFDTPLRINITTLSLNEEYHLYDGDDILFKQIEKRGRVSLDLGLPFGRSSEILIGFGSFASTFGEVEQFGRASNYSFDAVTLSGNLGAKNFRLYYENGWDLRYRVIRQTHRTDEEDLETMVNGQLHYGTSLFQGHSALSLTGFYRYTSATLAQKGFIYLGDSPGFRGIPKNGVWARKASALSAYLPTPIWKVTAGTLVTGPFVDIGILEYAILKPKPVQYKAYGIGTYFFLKEVALPGVGIEVGYNPDYSGQFLKVSLGGSL
ncbi:hypothetical protein SAMN06296036_108213 [Pseudobacteriovorax antillogorgiicola]|uniref:Surface antigen n=2 Tax=Pseudobacteriovorax antillogorgiicola TaxID=1513793 RepID=A0A1Y6BYZ0_9BACT|nr:hypothetical protein EDD56_10834 [Pseudobacteriovorax antillogorgiicola]SMF27357.1 hypothetical protein SAMN06296036_108213 [Pseudobacteriovorax antillogorgiicola]